MIPQDITEVLDCDGDVWRRRGGDGWVFNESRAPWTESELMEAYGPLTRVDGTPLSDPISLKVMAAEIMSQCRAASAGGHEVAQVYALAEEVGEFVGAMRRWHGMARQNGTEDEAKAALADVILSAYCAADLMGWDVDEIVNSKYAVMQQRGWKEQA